MPGLAAVAGIAVAVVAGIAMAVAAGMAALVVAGMAALVAAGMAALVVAGMAVFVVAGIVAAAVAGIAEAVAVTREQRLRFVRIPGRNSNRLVLEKRILNKRPSLKPPYVLITYFQLFGLLCTLTPNNKKSILSVPLTVLLSS